MFCLWSSSSSSYKYSLCRDNFIKQMMELNTKIRFVFSIKILVSCLLNFAYNDEIVSLWSSDSLKVLNLLFKLQSIFFTWVVLIHLKLMSVCYDRIIFT